MPTLFVYATFAADIIVFIFAGYYILKLRSREEKVEKEEEKVDTNYHQVVDNALARERKILEDATGEADQIITGAEYISKTTKESINQLLQGIMNDVQKDTLATAQEFMSTYSNSLKQVSTQSLSNFANVTHSLEQDLAAQIKQFRETLLPNLEHELEEYKQKRLKQTEEVIIRVVQKVSQEVFNKSLPLADHQKLMIDSLEKAKSEGAFD